MIEVPSIDPAILATPQAADIDMLGENTLINLPDATIDDQAVAYRQLLNVDKKLTAAIEQLQESLTTIQPSLTEDSVYALINDLSLSDLNSTTDVNLNLHKLVNLLPGTEPNDAVTVDQLAQAISSAILKDDTVGTALNERISLDLNALSERLSFVERLIANLDTRVIERPKTYVLRIEDGIAIGPTGTILSTRFNNAFGSTTVRHNFGTLVPNVVAYLNGKRLLSTSVVAIDAARSQISLRPWDRGNYYIVLSA